MRRGFRVVSVAVSALAIVGTIGFSSVVIAEEKKMTGKELSFDRKKGNCLACHVIAGGEQGGNIGPPLVVMKARFPDRAVLRAQIADARIKNPDSIMLPFEPHGIMSTEEVDLVVDFIHGL